MGTFKVYSPSSPIELAEPMSSSPIITIHTLISYFEANAHAHSAKQHSQKANAQANVRARAREQNRIQI